MRKHKGSTSINCQIDGALLDGSYSPKFRDHIGIIASIS